MNILFPVLVLTLLFFNVEGIDSVFYPHGQFQCIRCPIGEKVKNHCTYDRGKSDCVACEEGAFADRPSFSKLCEKCTDCSETGQIIKKKCTRKKNTECQCPEKKYYNLDFCRSCIPPKIKKVRNEKEYCEYCEAGTYYNNTLEVCSNCRKCLGYGCNATHDTHCIDLPTSTTTVPTTDVFQENNEDTPNELSGGKIAGLVIGILLPIIIVIVVVGVICMKKMKKCCWKDKRGKVTEDTIEKQPLNEVSKEDVPSTSREYIMSNSKPKWWYTISRILIDNLNEPGPFITNLGTETFNSTAKWDQLNNNKFQTRLYNFMEEWYQNNKEPRPETIILALEKVGRHDIAKQIINSDELKKASSMPITGSSVQNNKDEIKKHPVEATDEDEKVPANLINNSVYGISVTSDQRTNHLDSVDNKCSASFLIVNLTDNGTDSDQTQPKQIDGSDTDD